MKSPAIPRNHIKATDLAKQMAITAETLRKWCDSGNFQGFCMGKTFVVDMETFSHFYEKHSNRQAYLQNCRSENSPRK